MDPTGAMGPLAAAGWGVLGSISLELLEILPAAKRVRGAPWRQPGEPGAVAFFLSVAIRVFLGSSLTAASTASGEICNELAAFITGAAAPVILAEKLLPLLQRKQS
jgi:hypothetical protein